MNTKQVLQGTCTMLFSATLLLGCAHAGAGESAAAPKAAPVRAAVQEADPYAKDGFYTRLVDGRLWVFEIGSEDHKAYVEKGLPARHVVRPGAGPGGITLRAVEMDTIIAYVAAQPGFYTKLDTDGRMWVFEEGSEDLKAFKEKGKPARHVVRPAGGPLGLTLKSVEMETIDAYRARF